VDYHYRNMFHIIICTLILDNRVIVVGDKDNESDAQVYAAPNLVLL
jgi:hypothetical protein